MGVRARLPARVFDRFRLREGTSMDYRESFVNYFTNSNLLAIIEVREQCDIGQVTHTASARQVSRTTPSRLHDAINRTGTPASDSLAAGVAARGEPPPPGFSCVLQSR